MTDQQTSSAPTNVPVGPTSLVGWGSSLALFALAVFAFLSGDRSEQTLGTLASGGAAVVILAVTQAGRYLQAREAAKKTPIIVAPVAPAPILQPVPIEGTTERFTGTYISGDDVDRDPPEEPFDPAHEVRDLHDAPGA